MRRLLFIACLLTCAHVAQAQQADRTLHWRSLDVAARLDADGRLHVRERQAIVFNGAWNGGERIFDVRPGQRLELRGITRIDETGVPHPLVRGGLDHVDHFDWADGRTVRWRSRLPGDPPFANQEIVYELDYTLSNILLYDGERYTLDHDFAFADRAGVIEDFSLQLDADPAWHAPALPLRTSRASLLPGSSVVVTQVLDYRGAGAPAGVHRGASSSARIALLILLLSGFLVLVIGFLLEESRRGRYAPLYPVSAIDHEWLRTHIFSLPPEVVGAAWDKTTSAPEVAAFIARMVQEGKLGSRVVREKRKDILHLRLLVARASLPAEERKLIDALFDNDAMETDTAAIRARYRSSGFNPASIIRAGIQEQVAALRPDRRNANPLGALLTTLLVVAVLATLGGGLVATRVAPLVYLPILAGGAGLLAIVTAIQYRRRVIDLQQKATMLLLFLFAPVAVLAAVLLGLVRTSPPPAAGVLLDLLALVLSLTWLVLRVARTPETRERLELRRTLAAARAYFMAQLSRKRPALADEWFPYLLAFGLGRHIDRWFRAFGRDVHEVAVFATSPGNTSSASANWTGGGELFGGGGGFAGGGAGRSWAGAVETFSAGVASPSSSGSGGGSSGGGSSGGGGGGGW